MTALRTAFFATAACALALAAPLASAQQVYRIVGPDGKVTFTDRAPDPSLADTQASSRLRAGGAVAAEELPYLLRQIVARYPVTLYTGDGCTPCANARVLLMQRGIPFAERTVNTAEDIEALKRLAGEATLPFATIGAQQLKGYSDVEWTQYLDAAGYPKQSQLPVNYRRAAAAPLAPAVAKPAASAASAPADTARGAVRPDGRPAPPRNPSNPAGIVF